MMDRAKRILDDTRGQGVQVFLPKDFALGVSIEAPGTMKISEGFTIPQGYMGLDIGPKTVEYFSTHLADTKTVFWNGPMGLFETPPYDQGTYGIAKALSSLTSIRVIGGGDSASAVVKAGLAEKMSHISTGGGATLEYLEGKPLPGLEALAV
jgi:3-phosphoglycerate kinase